MTTKRTLRVDSNINPDVKVGDRVKLTNDETLTHVVYNDNFDLLRKYPTLGIHQALEDLEGEVIQTGITNFVVERDNKFVTYVQDVLVKIEGQIFRTSSGAVRVLKSPEQIVSDKIEFLRTVKPVTKKLLAKITLLEDIRDEIINHK